MFLITNRRILNRRTGLRKFSKALGDNPASLRVAVLSRIGGDWDVDVLPELLPKMAARAIAAELEFPFDPHHQYYSGLVVAHAILMEARRTKKNVLFFCHGYNNDVRDLLDKAVEMEERYDVICIPFSWPSNGHTTAYLSDKDDARGSATALGRLFRAVHSYHRLASSGRRKAHWKRARAEHPGDAEACKLHYARLLEADCDTKMSFACHSMGNYVLEHATGPSGSGARLPVFDNIVLLAADTNVEMHRRWVERLRTKNRLYVLINEDDYALGISRKKPGDEQRERLGHARSRLDAVNARYVDVTDVPGVGDSHTYFLGDPVGRNSVLESVFRRMLHGATAEARGGMLDYAVADNIYSVSRG